MAGYNHGDKGEVVTKTTVVEVIYTTVCPVTETVHKPGNTYTTTFTTTSTLVTKVPSVIYETVHGPVITETAKEVVKVPVTDIVYTTLQTTVYEKTNVYVTTTCPVTTYTTIIKGETRFVTATNTKTVKVTSAHVVTEVQPITMTHYKDETVEIVIPGASTIVEQPTHYVTLGNTLTATRAEPPVTLVSPTTLTTQVPVTSQQQEPATTSAPVPTAAADTNNAPIMALVAGIIGIVALT